MIGIYKITNNITHKTYIGQSVNIERRFKEHCRRCDQQIDQSIQKYGIDAFDFTILEECLPEQLNDREDYWIAYYNSIVPNGYNMGYCHNTANGEGNGQHKISNEDVILMRNIYNQRQYQNASQVWRDYFQDKLSLSHFRIIFRGESWAHIMPEVFTDLNNDYYADKERTSWMYHQDGENNHQAIVSEEDAIMIRILYTIMPRNDIFVRFPQYTERTITSIISGQNWQYLPIYKKRQKIWQFPQNYTEQQKQNWIERVKTICQK